MINLASSLDSGIILGAVQCPPYSLSSELFLRYLGLHIYAMMQLWHVEFVIHSKHVHEMLHQGVAQDGTRFRRNHTQIDVDDVDLTHKRIVYFRDGETIVSQSQLQKKLQEFDVEIQLPTINEQLYLVVQGVVLGYVVPKVLQKVDEVGYYGKVIVVPCTVDWRNLPRLVLILMPTQSDLLKSSPAR